MMDYDILTTAEIDILISDGRCTEKDVIDFYGNEWWRDIPE